MDIPKLSGQGPSWRIRYVTWLLERLTAGRGSVSRTAHVNKSEDNGRMLRFSDRVTETMNQFALGATINGYACRGDQTLELSSSVILIEGLWEEWLPDSWRTSHCLKSKRGCYTNGLAIRGYAAYNLAGDERTGFEIKPSFT